MPQEQSFKCLIYVFLSSERSQTFLGSLELKVLSLSSNISPVADNAIELNVVKR